MDWLIKIASNTKIRRAVADVIHLIHVAKRSQARAAQIEKDPDRAFKVAIRAAAAAGGYTLSEREIGIIHEEVARVLMGEVTDDWKVKLAALDDMLAKHGF